MGASNKMNGSLPGWVNEDTGEHARCWTRRSSVLKLSVCMCVSVCVCNSQFTGTPVQFQSEEGKMCWDVDVTED